MRLTSGHVSAFRQAASRLEDAYSLARGSVSLRLVGAAMGASDSTAKRRRRRSPTCCDPANPATMHIPGSAERAGCVENWNANYRMRDLPPTLSEIGQLRASVPKEFTQPEKSGYSELILVSETIEAYSNQPWTRSTGKNGDHGARVIRSGCHWLCQCRSRETSDSWTHHGILTNSATNSATGGASGTQPL